MDTLARRRTGITFEDVSISKSVHSISRFEKNICIRVNVCKLIIGTNELDPQ